MITKKKLKDKSTPKKSYYAYYIQVDIIAEVATYKDYVKRSETDSIRTKFTKVQDIIWHKAGLLKAFPDKSETISKMSNHYKIEPKEGSALFWIQVALDKLKD